MLKFNILFQDQNIAVICKSENLLSVPYPGFRGKTALGLLEEAMRKRGTYSSKHRPFAVHRLDRETSGVMMFALNERAQKIIMDSWQTMVTERLYRAVAEVPRAKAAALNALADSGTIDSPLAYNAYNQAYVPKGGAGEKGLKGQNGGKLKTIPARTHYKIIARGKDLAMFELSLDTGRKNQIRAHLASLGFPLAGDKNYRARTNPFGRLALHARTLEYTDPWTKERRRFESPEPAEWEKACNDTIARPRERASK